MTARELAAEYLGSRSKSLTHQELAEILRRIDARIKSKPITLVLHLVLGFWAPLLYLDRWLAAILVLIGTPIVVVALYIPVFFYLISSPRMIWGLGYGPEPLLLLMLAAVFVAFVIWGLGFFYFNSLVDRINRDISESVIDEFLTWRVAPDTSG